MVRTMILNAGIMADALEVGFCKIKEYFKQRKPGVEDIEVIHVLFPNISRASFACFTREHMSTFLSTVHDWVKEILVGKDGCTESRLELDDEDEYDEEMPSWLANNEGNIDMRKRKWMEVSLVDESGEIHALEVRNDMPFGYFVTVANDHNVATGKVRFKHKNKTIFASSSRKKTLAELGIRESDEVHVVSLEEDDMSYTASTGTQNGSKRSKSGKKKSPRKGAKKKRAKSEPVHRQELTMQDYKRLHFKALARVFEEARQTFKEIRIKIDATTIQKTPPKVRSSKKKAVKHFSLVTCLPGENSVGAKAGKKAFPILVGDESNLYNPCLAKKRFTDRMVLDLHGCSIKEALKKLDKHFPVWVDAAMSGEYPFVIPVDIISGGGNQILSGVVAQWIRRQPKVANKPKGFA